MRLVGEPQLSLAETLQDARPDRLYNIDGIKLRTEALWDLTPNHRAEMGFVDQESLLDRIDLAIVQPLEKLRREFVVLRFRSGFAILDRVAHLVLLQSGGYSCY
jgi:hypothetical protein